jgi:hypothetical protein
VRIIELRDILNRDPLVTDRISELLNAYNTVILALVARYEDGIPIFNNHVGILKEMEKICNHYKGTISMLLSRTTKVEDPYNVDPYEVNLSEIENEVLDGWIQYVSCHHLAFLPPLNCLS